MGSLLLINGSQQQTDLNLTPLHNGYIVFVKDWLIAFQTPIREKKKRSVPSWYYKHVCSSLDTIVISIVTLINSWHTSGPLSNIFRFVWNSYEWGIPPAPRGPETELRCWVGSIFIVRGVSLELLWRGGDTPWLKNKTSFQLLTFVLLSNYGE